MLKNRVIPCLLLRNGGLYKTTKFDNPKYVGDPINAIRIFNDKEVDELMVLDIEASRQGRSPDYDLIEQIAAECFMPLCYGGGIASMDQASQLFALGVEKVSLQTAVLDDFSLLARIAERYGSQSVSVSIDIKKNWLGRPQLYSSARTITLKKPWTTHLEDAVGAGAGEVAFNVVDRDGTMAGMDLQLISQAASSVTVPLIAMGGAASLADIKKAVDAGASAVAAGAYFVFYGPHRAVLITYPKYSELEALFSPQS